MHIRSRNAIQISTYAKFTKEILNSKMLIIEEVVTDMLANFSLMEK
jgi:hypothetical protein